MNIILGVSGGIAAYKAVLVVRALSERGHTVRVVPTANALRFVGAPTWEALTGRRVTAEVFENVADVEHVALGRWADVIAVVPATADLIARAAAGRADDLLTATLLTSRAPVLMAPAMHTEMWQHPATVANVALLTSRGVRIVPPDDGRLTGPDSGPGRLPDPQVIVSEILACAAGVQSSRRSRSDTAEVVGEFRPLTGRTVVISAGGTREALDPVRYLGNRSSGRQGFALAEVAARLGAEVSLVAANTTLPVPEGVRLTEVVSTAELHTQMVSHARNADVVVMAAAVADFRPAAPEPHKIKKGADGAVAPLQLIENPDILAELAGRRRRPQQVVVGFAAETGDHAGSVLQLAQAKARRKGADLLVVNDVSNGQVFGSGDNAVTLLDGRGVPLGTVSGSKTEVAEAVWATVIELLGGPDHEPAG